MSIPAFRDACDAGSVIMVQIEDESALDHLDEIAAVEDVDLMFVGPADLSQSMGVDFPSPRLDAAIDRVVVAGRDAGVAVGLFVGNAAQIPEWRSRGVNVFVCGSDQSLLRTSASQMMAAARG